MVQALALKPEQAIQTASAPLLDRHNLQFFASMIKAAGLVPQERNIPPAQSEARVMAKIVGGQSYGFDPIQSQENLHIINGRITLSSRGMAQLLHRSGRYTTRIKQLDDQACVLIVLQRDEKGEYRQLGEVSFTVKDAQKAGIASSNPNWQKYTADMLFARAITRVVRRFAPDVLDGQQISYDLAKREETPAPEPAAPQLPQNVTPITPPSVGEVYTDPTYTEVDPIAEALADTDDGFTPTVEDTPESIAALQKAAKDLLFQKTNGDATQNASILKGRKIDQMDGDGLREFIGELDTLAF